MDFSKTVSLCTVYRLIRNSARKNGRALKRVAA